MKELKQIPYDELVQMNQNGQIDDLQFLLAQEDLAESFLAEVKNPNPDNAREWLSNYENENLYT
ncbi:hypothetical protein [uncultured Draconibacterium sp.]|jgi:hypothetical protein|uniref:hypothetical protein n=1 Tax=uncultured Draconibacterium sp. TaxID=1573823 RepID=UPI0029C7035A|nr:hypothetical protein [uncultured Draconibacterium sp.]